MKSVSKEDATVPTRSNAIAIWVVALGLVLLAGAIRYLLQPLLGHELPHILFVAAALISAWYGGMLAGVVTLMLGLLAAEFLFVSPTDVAAPSDAARLVRYVFTTGLGIILIEVLRRQRQRAEMEKQRAEREMARCREVEQQLRQAHEQIIRHAEELEKRVDERTQHLRATVRSLERVLYHIAHDLRGPLRAMNGFSELLLREHTTTLNARGRELIGRIADAAARMDLLIRDLLAFGRLGHVEVQSVKADLNSVLQRVIEDARELLLATGAKVDVQPLHAVRGEPRLLEEVFSELLDNAVRFVPPQRRPEVRIWSAQESERVRIHMEDNGVGIPDQHRHRVFGVFEQLEPKKSHTGMGLALANAAVERLGGKITVEAAPAGGSRFCVELPAANES